MILNLYSGNDAERNGDSIVPNQISGTRKIMVISMKHSVLDEIDIQILNILQHLYIDFFLFTSIILVYKLSHLLTHRQ